MTEHISNIAFHLASSKIEAMKRAGIVVAGSPAEVGEAVLKAIG